MNYGGSVLRNGVVVFCEMEMKVRVPRVRLGQHLEGV